MSVSPLLDTPLKQLLRSSEPLLRELARRLPKVDLHRHLEGSLRPEFLFAHVQRRVRAASEKGGENEEISIRPEHILGVPCESVEALAPHVTVAGAEDSFFDFLKKFEPVVRCFSSPEEVKRATRHVIDDCYADNIRYLELRFAPFFMALSELVTLDEVMQGVVEAVEEAKEALSDMTVTLIVIVERNIGVEKAVIAKDLALKYKDRGVVALDLANDELNYPADPYKDVFHEAKENGLAVTVHAGEAVGAENVRQAVELLGATRIGHGMRSFEDDRVMDMLVDRGIVLEVCPTSNLQTCIVESIEAHPIRRFFDRGIKVALSSDDPGISNITLSDEFYLIMDTFGFTFNELRTIIMNAVTAVFGQSDADKARLASTFSAMLDEVAQWVLIQCEANPQTASS